LFGKVRVETIAVGHCESVSRAMKEVHQRYSWDAVTDAYEKLLTRLAGTRADLKS